MAHEEILVPDGMYPPFAVISESDHSGLIIIASALGLSLVLLFSAIRIFIRRAQRQGVAIDDAALAAATIFVIIKESVTMGAASKGLGASIELIDPSKILSIEKSFYVGHIISVLALGLTKISVGLFILRLTPIERHRRAVNGILVLVAVWTVASTFAMAIQCNPSRPWVVVGTSCPGSYKRQLVIGIFDGFSEVALVGSTVLMVACIQATLWTKASVVLAFCFRLPLLIFIAKRLSSWNEADLTTNFTRQEADYIVWTQVQISYAVIAATIPTVRRFISNLSTCYGAQLAPYSSYIESSSVPTGNPTKGFHSVQLTSLKSIGKVSSEEVNDGNPTFVYGATTETYITSNPSCKCAQHGRHGVNKRGKEPFADEISVESAESQQMIIRKNVNWFVEHSTPI